MQIEMSEIAYMYFMYNISYRARYRYRFKPTNLSYTFIALVGLNSRRTIYICVNRITANVNCETGRVHPVF